MKSRFFRLFNREPVRRPIVVAPVERVYTREPFSVRFRNLIGQASSKSGQIAHTVLLVILLALITVYVAVHGYPLVRLIESDSLTPQALLDIITHFGYLSERAILSSLAATLLTVYIFIPVQYSPDSNSRPTTGGFGRFITALILLALIDLVLFEIDIDTLVNPNREFIAPARHLVNQACAVMTMAFLLLVFRSHVRIEAIDVEAFLPSFARLLSWIRFFLVSIGLIVVAGWITTHLVQNAIQENTSIARSEMVTGNIHIPVPFLTAVVISAATASATFAPARYFQQRQRLALLRLVVFTGSLALAGWSYSHFELVEDFLLIVVTAAILTTILVIPQRALS